MNKKILSTLMAAAIAASSASCVMAAEDVTLQEGGTMKLATVSAAGSIDPADVALDLWTEYCKMCVEGMVSYDSEGNMIYEAAESIDISDDELVYTFHLRDNKWSDGSDVVADDFLNTMFRALDPENGMAIYANMLYYIDGAEAYNKGEGAKEDVKAVALDDKTLEITLKAPCSYFLSLLSMPVYYPSKTGLATNEDETWEKNPETSLGNGAFCLESFTDGDGYTMVKNPYYYQADKVKLDRVEVKFMSEPTAQITAFESGDYQVVTGLPDYIQDTYTEENGLFIWTMLTSKFVLPNLNSEPLNDVRVREALALAINREQVCGVIGTDYIPSVNYVAEYMLSPSGSGEYFKDEQEPLFTEDVARAQELLAEAGYPGGEGFPTLRFIYPNREKDALFAQGIQAQLKANLNIDIELIGEEDDVYAQDRKEGNYDLARHSWTADFNDPINYLNLYVGGASSNYNGVNDADFDAAIAASDAATDPVERAGYLHEAQNILVAENFYVIPIDTQIYVCLMDPSLGGITKNEKGEPMYRFAGYKAQ